jgi:hypothetical protein
VTIAIGIEDPPPAISRNRAAIVPRPGFSTPFAAEPPPQSGKKLPDERQQGLQLREELQLLKL